MPVLRCFNLMSLHRSMRRSDFLKEASMTCLLTSEADDQVIELPNSSRY